MVAARKEAEASMNLMEERYQRILRGGDKEAGDHQMPLWAAGGPGWQSLRSDLEESEDVIDITKAVQC